LFQRYEIPEESISKTRIPEDKPDGDHYQPSPSYYEQLKRKPDEPRGGEKYKSKPTEHRYSRYGEKESSKGKKGSSEEQEEDEADDRSGSPSEYNYNTKRGSSSEEDGGSSGDYDGKPTEYSFSSSKKEPTKTYSYFTTDPPVDYYYETSKVCTDLFRDLHL
jgi:hypothetical protein